MDYEKRRFLGTILGGIRDGWQATQFVADDLERACRDYPAADSAVAALVLTGGYGWADYRFNREKRLPYCGDFERNQLYSPEITSFIIGGTCLAALGAGLIGAVSAAEDSNPKRLFSRRDINAIIAGGAAGVAVCSYEGRKDGWPIRYTNLEQVCPSQMPQPRGESGDVTSTHHLPEMRSYPAAQEVTSDEEWQNIMRQTDREHSSPAGYSRSADDTYERD